MLTLIFELHPTHVTLDEIRHHGAKHTIVHSIVLENEFSPESWHYFCVRTHLTTERLKAPTTMPLTKGCKKNTGKRDDSPETGVCKKDKYSSDEDEQPVMRKGKAHTCKMTKQGKMSKRSPNIITKATGPNTSHNKPAELFRKDLISAMKMADTEILFESEYFVISDPWRQEWEKGVQVPVNEEEIPPITIRDMRKNAKTGDFKLPLRKYLHEKVDDTYQAGIHELTGMQDLAEQIVRYDLDDQDVTWLELVNDDREEMGLQLINEWNMERMIEELENQCYIKTNALKKTEEGLGIEYDEDVACDVCHMLESEDTNEMVFCDGCDICVHQACYGIQTIPEGSWLCRICALGIKPMCLLCPKRGGAMKSTKSGTKWTHVSCALWIPEVSIGCPEKMEPVTKISNIPPSRWALVCSLCKERVGACIQCSVKQCKTAFHVTCGFAHNLDMRTIVDESDEADGIHLRAYCPKHTKNRNASDCESPKKEEDALDTESEMEVTKKRQEKLQQIEEDFFNLVDVKEIADKFYIPEEAVDIVAEYWKLKRRANNNKPLITPKMEEEDRMQKQQQDSLSARMKMFVHLRQDLERARNLCYMISKREKTKRQFFKLKESVFLSQVRVLTDPDLNLSAREAEKIRQEYNFDSIYSNYGMLSPRNSKQPRENLFNLHNLKTPKDYIEEDRESSESDKKVASSQSNLGKEVKVRTSRPSSDSTSSSTLKNKSSDNHRENLFSVDSFNIMSDSALESSEDEFRSNTHSAQMSRLGKVKLKEMEEQPEDDVPAVIKTVPVSPPKKNFVATCDLSKKLSLFLQSKTKMQQQQHQHEKNHLERLEQVLHVDVGQSEMEDVFTSDTNTDLLSPVDQQRNLFDHFGMKSKQFLSPPDTAQAQSTSPSSHKQHKKYKKRKHKLSPPKIKKLRLVMSPPDQSTAGVTIKSEIPPTDDELAIKLTSPDNNRESLEVAVKSEVSYLITPGPKKRGRKKKIKQESEVMENSPLKLSPTPRVDVDSVYPTLDGDIYVPTGKILVTERTIVLNDPKEDEKSRPRSKLRLKKQADSPVKGLASYMVVKEGEGEDLPKARDHSKPKHVTDEKNIFDRVMDTTPLRLESTSVSSPSASRKMSDDNTDIVNNKKSFGSRKSPNTIDDSVLGLVNSKHEEKHEDNVETLIGSVNSKHKEKPENKLQTFKSKHKKKLDSKLTLTSKHQDKLQAKLKLETTKKSKKLKRKLEPVIKEIKEEPSTNLVNKNTNCSVSDDVIKQNCSKNLRTRIHDTEKTKTPGTIDVSPSKKLFRNTTEEKPVEIKEEEGSITKVTRRSLKKNEPTATGLSHEKTTPLLTVKTETPQDCEAPLGKTEGNNGYNIRAKHKVLERNRDLENGETSDENSTPKHSPSKILRSPRSRKSLPTDIKIKEEGDMSPKNVADDSNSGVKLAQLPNKPHLNALLEASKLMVKVDKNTGEQLKKRLKLRGRWGTSNGTRKDRHQSTLDSFVTRTSISNVFSKMEVAHQEVNGKSSCFSTFIKSDLSPLLLSPSLSQNISPVPDPGFGSSLKSGNLANSIFGSHTSRGSLNNYSVPRTSDSQPQSKTPDNKTTNEPLPVFGDLDKLTRQLSFEDISENSIVNKTNLEIVKTPSKCDLSALSEDKLDGHRSYRSQSPPSSEGSVTSCKISKTDPGLTTPRRITRSCVTEESDSPSTRLRKRDPLIKAPQFRL
ncbi:Protein Jade-1 [Biomphalaria glabrata]|nr:PHD finger protein rhinoceros [Biomphalaria glabrata]